ncbi:hypothetical protein BKH43_07490 [Helicobacter sp. 13S00401-1]|nr:hypothetical protein BKH43_07490 [Helicobacter sp. 13S00401-1]
MPDDASMREYLKAHGKSSDALDSEEIVKDYEELVKENIDYYFNLLKDDDILQTSNIFLEHKTLQSDLASVKTVSDLYGIIYKHLKFYSPSDLASFIHEVNLPITSKQIIRIISLMHAMLQDELLDSINLELKDLPKEEEETLMHHYEGIRDDVMALESAYHKLSSKRTLEYVKQLTTMKLDIMQHYLPNEMEEEYKPYYDNTKEKKEVINKILQISKIYSKAQLFDMNIKQLVDIKNTIVEQNRLTEKQRKNYKKYIEIFEDTANLSEEVFNENVRNALELLTNEQLSELLLYFNTRNHFILNKLNTAIQEVKRKSSRRGKFA